MSDEQTNQPVDSSALGGETPETSAPENTNTSTGGEENVVPEAGEEPKENTVDKQPEGSVAPSPKEEGKVKIYYNGSEVVEKLDLESDGAVLCKMSDGTTTYVPKTLFA